MARRFSFYLSCDVNLAVRVRISDLQGVLPSYRKALNDAAFPGEASSRPSAVHVVAQIVAPDDRVLGLETRTTYADSSPSGCVWGEWLTFCIKYRDLPHDAQLALTVWEMSEGSPLMLVGGTTMRMFNKKGRLKTGPQRLKVWEGRAPCTRWPTTTPGKVPLAARGRLGQLEHLVALYRRGDIAAVDWLDALTLGEIRDLQQKEAEAAVGQNSLQLSIDLPSFPHAVLYQQPMSYTAAAQGPANPGAVKGGAEVAGLADAMPGSAVAVHGGDKQYPEKIIVLQDPEVGRENPAELKAQKLARSLTRGVIDRDLKPNGEERRRINVLLKLPPNKPLHAEDRALLWRFRFALQQETRALTKFLKCVDWSDALEAKQAAELMAGWATIDIADALELLSPDFKNEEVRAHAVSVLQTKEDDELLYYLLQLVQALRYETDHDSRLSRFLISRACASPTFGILLHWYLYTEFQDNQYGTRFAAVHQSMLKALNKAAAMAAATAAAAAGAAGAGHAQLTVSQRVLDAIRRQSDMMSQLNYLIKELKGAKLKAARATQRLVEMVSESGPCGELTVIRVPLPLDPNIMLDGVVPSECMCFKSAQLPLRLHFKVDPRPVNWRPAAGGAAAAAHQQQPEAQQQGGAAQASMHAGYPSASATPAQIMASLPSRTGIVIHNDAVRCVMIYKKGDDLRQDQFILQMIGLMDRLLRRENLDLRLTPYKVLPTSPDDGLVEFVPSMPLSRVLSEHRTIHRYLALTQAEPSGPFGLKAEALETFVRSCAGYCVATYILGVGDRHLDNLMLASDGRLFHIDFGYILGSDPKPFPPPMKICKEMVEAMGGQDSAYYVQFRMYACEAYNILRKSADLILSLFHLMAGASIEAIRADPEKAILKLQEKFRLDLDDEQAVQWMQQLINESATALMPQIVETTHRWAQYWR